MKVLIAMCAAVGLLLPSSASARAAGIASAEACDVVAQTGCGPGEKCAVVLDDSGAQRIACAPDGTVPVGGRCGSFAGVDDCVGGTACVNGTCREVCDPAQPGVCPTAQTCTAAGTTGVGTCATLTSTASSPDLAASTCDVVTQTGCGPGEKCAVVLDDSGAQRIACAPDGTVALGGRCGSFAGVDDCVGGTACVNGTCREVCDPAQPGACPTPQTCTAAGTTGVGTCATLTSTTSPDSDDAPSTAAAPPPTSSGAACRQHQDCRPGTYCAADGTCHPDSHRPRGVTASPSLRNFRSGRVCTGPDGTQTVCQEAVDIVIDGRDQCEFNHEKVRCNWFGWEFDYENFDPSIPIRCAWVRSMPADEGNRDGIRQENATRGTSESWLPGACGHFISPGFQNYAVPRDGRRVVVNTRFDCSYDGKPLFDVEYRFHFGP